MNKKLKDLGIENTNFVNSHGLYDKDHYTTARDMALIGCELFEHPEVFEIMQTRQYVIEETDTVEDLDKKIRDARASLSNCEDVIVLCDILGGSPFKTAVMAFFGDEHVKVLYGTNVGMAMKLCMECMLAGDSYNLDSICDSLVEEGNMHIGKYQFVAVEEEDMEDGI